MNKYIGFYRAKGNSLYIIHMVVGQTKQDEDDERTNKMLSKYFMLFLPEFYF